MRAIFISYRRDDSEGEAGRLFDDLVAQFGEGSVFMDVAGIEAGRDFRKAIDESVATCGALLAIIGKGWIDVKNEAGQRRLDDPNDFVRLETASALKRDIPVIPVLVRGATMPRADQLPEGLRELAYRNAVELTHARWNSDLQLLIKALRPYVDESKDAPGSQSQAAGAAAVQTATAPVVQTAPNVGVNTSPTPAKKPMGLFLGVVAAVLVIGAVAAYMMMPKHATVPDLTGTTLPSATAKLQALKLAVGQTTSKDDATMDPNTVVGQSPPANTTVKSGTIVDLVISQRPQSSATVEIPSLVGKSLDMAQIELRQRQLVVGEIQRESKDGTAKDTVLREFPSSGESVKPGAKIDLVVAAAQAAANAEQVPPPTQARPAQSPPAQAPLVPAGELSIMNVRSELCLSPAGGANGRNVQIVQFMCDQDLSRFWRFVVIEGDVVQIKNSLSDLCLTIAGGSADRNIASVQYLCDKDPSRRWRYSPVDRTTFRLVNVKSGLCLTIAGGGAARNTTAVQYACDGDPSRDWRIVNPR
jgi:hypothetical protein